MPFHSPRRPSQLASTTPSRRPRLRLVPAVASAVLLGASYPPGVIGGTLHGVLAVVALVPLGLRWMQAPPTRLVLAEAWLTWFGAGLVAFTWVLAHPFWTTQLASVGGLMTWAAAFAVPWTVAAATHRRWGRAAGLVVLVATHLVVEGTISRGPWALPWGLLGHTLADVGWIRPLAAWLGTAGLSLWVLLGNLTLVLLAARLRPSLFPASPSRSLALLPGTALPGFALSLLILSLFAFFPRAEVSPSAASASASVLLVQPGVDAVRWADLTDTSRVDDLLQQTQAALDARPDSPPDLVVWPETALPPIHAQQTIDSLQAWVDASGVSLLAGAIFPVAGTNPAPSQSLAPSKHAVYQNQALLLRPLSPLRAYAKRHLVPFAEHVPGAQHLPALQHLAVPAGGVRGYRRGDGPAAFPIPLAPRRAAPQTGRSRGTARTGPLHVGPLICFESVIGPYARQFIQHDASRPSVDAFVTLAQVGWWGDSRAQQQFLDFTRLTAVQTGRSVAVVTVSGPTVVVGPDGVTRAALHGRRALRVGPSATRFVTLPRATRHTPFVRHGDTLFGASLAGLVLATLVAAAARFRTANRPSLDA